MFGRRRTCPPTPGADTSEADFWRWRGHQAARLKDLGVACGRSDGHWPITGPTTSYRCVFTFPDGHGCHLVSHHDRCDHLDLECAATADVDREDPRYRNRYGPTGFVREYTDAQYAAFEANAMVIHVHSWLGGEIVQITNMPGEANLYEHEWFCQFCGVRCRGETLKYAAKSLKPAPERPVRADVPGG